MAGEVGFEVDTEPEGESGKYSQFSVQVLAEIVKLYFETGSPCEARKKFKEKHQVKNEKECPSAKTIRRCANQFLKTGSVGRKAKTRTSTKRTSANLEKVEAILKEHPKTSVRHIAKELCIGRETVRRMVQDVRKKKRAETIRNKPKKGRVIVTQIVETPEGPVIEVMDPEVVCETQLVVLSSSQVEMKTEQGDL